MPFRVAIRVLKIAEGLLMDLREDEIARIWASGRKDGPQTIEFLYMNPQSCADDAANNGTAGCRHQKNLSRTTMVSPGRTVS